MIWVEFNYGEEMKDDASATREIASQIHEMVEEFKEDIELLTSSRNITNMHSESGKRDIGKPVMIRRYKKQ